MKKEAECYQCGRTLRDEDLRDPDIKGFCVKCVKVLEWRGEMLEREAQQDKAIRLATAMDPRIP